MRRSIGSNIRAQGYKSIRYKEIENIEQEISNIEGKNEVPYRQAGMLRGETESLL
jgi:hypothetical protein